MAEEAVGITVVALQLRFADGAELTFPTSSPLQDSSNTLCRTDNPSTRSSTECYHFTRPPARATRPSFGCSSSTARTSTHLGELTRS